jgi:hypothetical protein
MLWEDWVTGIATAIGSDVTSAGILVSCLFIIAITLIVSLVAKTGFAVLLTGFMSTTIFTVAGWLPYWTILLLVLVVAGMFASQIKRWFG